MSLAAGIFLPVLLMCSCLAGSSHAAAGGTLKIAGSTTVLPIAARAAEAFKKTRPGVTVTVNAGGSGVGFNSVAGGRVDIGLMSRAIGPAEKEKFAGLPFKVFTVGRDAVACVVSSEVFAGGVTALSKEEIRGIYLGKKTNWKAFGGPDRRIVVIDKEMHRGTRHVFMKYVMGDARARAPGARLVTGSNNEEQAKIAQSDSAVGMLSLAWINQDVAGVGIREANKILRPTLDGIRSGTYPISRDLNMVTVGEPAGLAEEFIDFVLGPQGQKIVEQSGYVAIR